MVLVHQRLTDARVVAGVRPRRAVADLAPGPLALLAAATAEEEVIVDLIVRRSPRAVPDGRRRALDADDDGRVVLVGEDVAPEAVVLPAKVVLALPLGPDVVPAAPALGVDVGVGRHERHREDRPLVRDIRCRHLVERPGVGVHHGSEALPPRLGHQRVDDRGPPVDQTLYRLAPTHGHEARELGQLLAAGIVGGEEEPRRLAVVVSHAVQLRVLRGAMVVNVSEGEGVLGGEDRFGLGPRLGRKDEPRDEEAVLGEVWRGRYRRCSEEG